MEKETKPETPGRLKTNKKFLKPRHFVIRSEVFRCDILVCINYRSADVNKALDLYEGSKPITTENAEYIDDKKAGSACFLFNEDTNHRVIVLFPRTYAELISLFDHEKFHALYHIFNHIGMGTLCTENEEVWAYTSEYLMEQFLNKI